MLDQIPYEILFEILTRLPAKSVCRFKCVSKIWKSLICNPNFISSYISHNSPSSTSWAIVDRSISFNSNKEQHVIHFNFAEKPKICSLSVNPNQLAPNSVIPKKSKYTSVILTSSNGLFLISVKIERNPKKEFEKDPTFFLHSTSESLLFVVNPITGKWVPLPKTKRPISQLTSIGFVTRVDSCGVVDKFVVVEYNPVIGSNYAVLLCFDSDTWKWEELSSNYMLLDHFWRAEGVFEINGRLFWFDLSCGVIAWGVDAFRGVEKGGKAVCRFIQLPSGCRKPYNTLKLEEERGFFGSGGCIHYMERFRNGDCLLKLWRLKDYEACDGEWSLVYNVCRVDVGSCWLRELQKFAPKSCLIDPFDVDIVFFMMPHGVFSYNFRTRKVEKCANVTGPEYVFPSVLPCWPASLSPRLYATYAKEEGNTYFKEQNFTEAIKSYSKGIAVSPNAFAFANRALAYLKLSRFYEAEDDCTKALNLDNEYVKVYGRRAIARKEIGNLKGTLEDIESFLKFYPKNEAMKKQYAEIKFLLEKECSHGGCS